MEVTEIVLEGEAANGCTYGGTPPVFPYVAYNNNAQVVYVANLDCSGEPSQGVFIASLDNDVGGGDGVLDFLDNCPAMFNPDQKNSDKASRLPYVVGDDLGNACDDDIDGDGSLNTLDACPSTPTPWATPLGDADCDGFSTADEGVIGTDPADNCANTPDPNDEVDDRWPSDFDDNQIINLGDVFLVLPPYFGTSCAP